MRTLGFLLRKEFLQIFRDRFMVRIMIVMPIVQLLLLSSAATFEVKRAQMYVVDRDHSAASRGLVDRLRASRRFVVAGASPSMALADESMLARRVGLIVNIPADFEHDLVHTGAARVQLVLNAEDGAAAGVTRSYASQVIAAYANERAGANGAAAHPVLDVQTRGWYNLALDYRDYMVPASRPRTSSLASA